MRYSLKALIVTMFALAMCFGSLGILIRRVSYFDTDVSTGTIEHTDLGAAIYCSDFERVVQIIDRDPSSVDQQDSDGRTPLHIAVLQANERIAQLLLERGADITLRDRFGVTAKELATKLGRGSYFVVAPGGVGVGDRSSH